MLIVAKFQGEDEVVSYTRQAKQATQGGISWLLVSFQETDDAKKQEYEKQLQDIEDNINVRSSFVFDVVLYPLS